MATEIRDLSRAVSLFHALSDETRLEIIDRLKDGEQCVCDLMDALQSAQSKLSFHLKVLKEAKLIEDRREGRWMYYSLNERMFEELHEVIASFKRSVTGGRLSKRCE